MMSRINFQQTIDDIIYGSYPELADEQIRADVAIEATPKSIGFETYKEVAHRYHG